MLYTNPPAIKLMVQYKYLLYILFNYIRVSLCCVCALDNGCLCQHISVPPVHHRDENEIHLMLQLTIQQIDFITMVMAC